VIGNSLQVALSTQQVTRDALSTLRAEWTQDRPTLLATALTQAQSAADTAAENAVTTAVSMATVATNTAKEAVVQAAQTYTDSRIGQLGDEGDEITLAQAVDQVHAALETQGAQLSEMAAGLKELQAMHVGPRDCNEVRANLTSTGTRLYSNFFTIYPNTTAAGATRAWCQFGYTPMRQNLARGRPTAQSSTASSGDPGRAVDGNRAT
jgi:hypothetical protein